MSLTIGSTPEEVITNTPEFTVTTSLTEGASYQNLRIRATIYIGGQTEAVAVLEQPKGLDDWDFFALLKSLTAKCDVAVGGAVHHAQPNMGTEKLTGWTDLLSTFETFTTSGRQITSAIDTNASGGVALGNDMGAMSPGDIVIVGIENNWADIGAQASTLSLAGNVGLDIQSQALYSGLSGGRLRANRIYPLMVIEDLTTSYVTISTSAGSNCNFGGTVTGHKISDFRNNPGVYFMVKFEEIYENSSDVTTTGDTEWSGTILFLPVSVRPGENFETDYLFDFSGHKLLSRGEEDALIYKFGIDMEIRTLYATNLCWLKADVINNKGTEIITDIPNAGWGIFIVGDATMPTYPMDAAQPSFSLLLSTVNFGGSAIYSGPLMSVDCDQKCYPDARAISFVGDLGEETVLFRGLHTKTGRAEKSFFRNVKRVKKVLKAYRYIRHKLRTVREAIQVRELLHELTYTDIDVWMYDTDEPAGYKDVTVIDDDVPLTDKNELLESAIDIEYYE